MLGAGRAPDPAVAAELGIDPVFLAEGFDVVGGFSEGLANTKSAVFTAKGLERCKLRPLREHHAGIAPRGAAAADIGFDDRHIERRIAVLDLQRRPHAGIAAADNADIGALAAFEARRIHLARRDRLAQPDAAAFSSRRIGHRVRKPPGRRP